MYESFVSFSSVHCVESFDVNCNLSHCFLIFMHTLSERLLEDHELIQDVLKSWPKKHPPYLILKSYPYKYAMWINSPVCSSVFAMSCTKFCST